MDMERYIESILHDAIEIEEGTPTSYAKHALYVARNFFLENHASIPGAKEDPLQFFIDYVMATYSLAEIDPIQRIAELQQEIDRTYLAHQAASFSMYMIMKIAIEYSLEAIQAESDGISQIAWMSACDAMYWAGFLKSSAGFLSSWKSKAAFSKRGAKAKHASDPKQTEKALVRQHWENWQKSPDLYQTRISFARAMYRICNNLESLDTIRRWERDWRKEMGSADD